MEHSYIEAVMTRMMSLVKEEIHGGGLLMEHITRDLLMEHIAEQGLRPGAYRSIH